MTSAHYQKYPTSRYRTKEEHAKQMREWRASNLSKSRGASLRWAKANPEKVRAASRARYAKNKAAIKLNNWRYKGIPSPTRPMPNVCECCGKPPNIRGMHLDHCHSAGIFRGWLCHHCNTGIGLCGDSIEGLERALEYLRKAYREGAPKSSNSGP